MKSLFYITALFFLFSCTSSPSEIAIDPNGGKVVISCLQENRPELLNKLDAFEKKLLEDQFINSKSLEAYLKFTNDLENGTIDLPQNYLRSIIHPSDIGAFISCMNRLKEENADAYKNQEEYYNFATRLFSTPSIEMQLQVMLEHDSLYTASEIEKVKEMQVPFRTVTQELFSDALIRYCFLNAVHGLIHNLGNGYDLNSRTLPPPLVPKTGEKAVDAEQQITVYINSKNEVYINDQLTSAKKVKNIVKHHIIHAEKEEGQPSEYGTLMPTKASVLLQNENGTGYDIFLQVQEGISAAYAELRNELSQEKFNITYDSLMNKAKSDREEEREAAKNKVRYIRKSLPQKVSEREP